MWVQIKGIITRIIILVLLITFNFGVGQAGAEDDLGIHKEQGDIKVPILLYHNIAEEFDIDQSSVHISPELFREHMLFLKSEGYTTITFDDYYNYTLNEGLLPDKPIIITFDDGYESNYEYAYPILKELGMKATIFILTGRMGFSPDVTYPHFTWEQAREMQESGTIDIQSHSDLHVDMAKSDKGRIQLEMRRSKYLIEKELGKPCDVFAYPYGSFNIETQGMAEKAGYKIQLAVGDRGVNGKSANIKQLKRLTAFGDMSGRELLNMIADNLNSLDI